MTDQPQDTAPPKTELHKIELLPDDDAKDFTLHSKAEVTGILRSMLEQGALITAYFNQGRDFLLTSLLKLGADGKTLVMDFGSDTEMNKRALACDKLICVSNLDKVKIQFTLPGVAPTQFDGRSAFLAEIPATLLRLQRRDFYRLVLPVLQPLKCFVPLKTYDGTTRNFEMNVIDISGGGIGIVAKSEFVEISSDMLLANCKLDLPNVGTLVANLRVRSVYEVTLRTGARHKRAGCQFIDLTAQMQMMVQRYIIKEERERKARESGMA